MSNYFFKNSLTKRFGADNFRAKTFEGEAEVAQSPACWNEMEAGNAQKLLLNK